MPGDWLLEIGVDTTKADSQIKDFVSNTTNALAKAGNITLTVNAAGARKSIENFAAFVKSQGTLQSFDLKINVTGATAAFKSFMTQVRENTTGIQQFTNMMRQLEATMQASVGIIDAQANAYIKLTAAMNEMRIANRTITTDIGNATRFGTQTVAAFQKMQSATKASGDSLTWLGK